MAALLSSGVGLALLIVAKTKVQLLVWAHC
ncbi:hypothetical protein DEU29_11235 [Idiomarina aquatica]|uniref:Uncharacterized protein n=1 Tax=Idiomarina aquatica TaxID=1327752 RepID=A0A4R6P1R2_9GAMM|nr:hypothetical protein DEU29_11235 [Idiomarina aquatica]